jgi:hypothetical protein
MIDVLAFVGLMIIGIVIFLFIIAGSMMIDKYFEERK